MADASADTPPVATLLKDYKPPAFLVDEVRLDFNLQDDGTIVESTMQLARNPASTPDAPLVLNGQSLELLSLKLDGQELDPGAYVIKGETLEIAGLPDRASLSVKTRIHPADNTTLEGLYMSHDMYCTQCEAEGFRRITWFPDRPDVLTRFTTTIEADKQRYPVLLSNGNLISSETLPDNRHRVSWQDPFPKPCYLFALVAGDLECIRDTHTTPSGREVDLRIYVESVNADKCEHAMRSLKQSMEWDEQVFGLEYDLDIYMIVAVDHFNMGAMENKGLNIFNSKFVLARPETATDTDYINIQGVIGHEYFHNWTGNRVTCRDWFQLSLKEGLTVFRDQEFTADMNSRGVKRIADVRMLRTAQFPEDGGPMSHPVRPDSYIEINNFYTLTVYEKGAELIRMMYTLLGRENFRKGMDLYFERHDGQAVTTEDFACAMQDASGIDLSHFRKWYTQAGTPVLTVSDEYDSDSGSYTLNIRQHTPPTPGQDEKEPLHVPLAMALLDGQGNELPLQLANETPGDAVTGTRVLNIHQAEESFCFTGLTQKPVPSLLRGFSAPVRLKKDWSDEELSFLLARDSDSFNRWDAGQTLATRIMLQLVEDIRSGGELQSGDVLVSSVRSILEQANADRAWVTEALTLPSEALLADAMDVIAVDEIHQARRFVRRELAGRLEDLFHSVYQANRTGPDYTPDAESMARRGLCNLALNYLAELETDASVELLKRHYYEASNMTDAISALGALANSEHPLRDEVLAHFYQRWENDNLVIDKWFTIQATSRLPDTLQTVESLMRHPAFDIRTPNRVRSLVGAFSHANPVRFHQADGAGYRFLADRVLELDEINPQVASRMCGALVRWRRYDDSRQQLMRSQIERILARPSLSSDVYEVCSKSLA